MRIGYNMLGQQVDLENPNLADGYYLLDANPENSPCGELRQAVMVIGGHQTTVCAGNLIENHLPDVIITDDPWKIYVRYGQIALIAIILLLIVKQLRS